MEQNYEDIVRDWYNRLRPEVLRLLTVKYSSLTLYEAENLYQDAFIAVQENLLQGRVEEDTNWHAYILRICNNMAERENDKLKMLDSIDVSEDMDEDRSFSSTALKVKRMLKTLSEEETPLYKNPEAQSLLGEEIAHTPEPCCSIIRLYYYEDLSMEEIAESVGYKNATTTKAKKSQCMKELMRRVKDVLKRAGITL